MAISKEEAQHVTRAFVRDYPGALALGYRFREDATALYGRNASKVPANLKGGYWQEPVEVAGRKLQGRVDVALGNTQDAADLVATLRHEVLGHFGINTFAPVEKQAMLQALVEARHEPSLVHVWDAVDRMYRDESLMVRAEEVFALHAESVAPRHRQNSEVGQSAPMADAAEVRKRGQQSFAETCMARVRPLQADDLQRIVAMVAEGLHDLSRTQRTFIATQDLLRKDDEAEARKPFHEVVAQKLIEQLKQGSAPWQKPWAPGEPAAMLPMNPTTGNRYKGINAIHLMAQGRTDQRWLTYRQAEAVGAQVRKGERGAAIQIWKFEEEMPRRDAQGKPILNERGEPVTDRVKLERPRVFHATVFNAEQIDGLPPVQRPSVERGWNPSERAESLLQASGATVHHGPSNRAFYQLATDSIHMPEQGQFASADRYYAVALHELGHWTGHPSRLSRDLIHPFGSEGYAKEELRAEIASMLLGDELGIGHDPAQHVAYVKSWIAVLENDPLEIFRAAAEAEKIQGFIMALEQQLEQQQAVGQVNVADPVASPIDSPSHGAESAEGRTYLGVPYGDKDAVKALGAKWDRQQQAWYAPPNADLARFGQWVDSQQPQSELSAHRGAAQETRAPIPRRERQYLAVPFEDRVEAKAAGAAWDVLVKSWYVGPNADVGKLQRWTPEHVQAQVHAEQGPAMHPREEFALAMRAQGLVVEGDHPLMDGQKHRVPVEGGKPGAVDGFYVLFADGHPAGRIINHKTGADERWRSKGYALDPAQKAALQAVAAANSIRRVAETEQKQAETAARVAHQLEALMPLDRQTPYLAAKGVQVHPGAFTDAEQKTTFIPAIDSDNKLWSMQYIHEDGTKRFAKDGRKEGTFHAVGGLEALAKAPVLVISEGYATAATLSEALGFATVAAFDSGNLLAVAKSLQVKFPQKPIAIAGDDDHHREAIEGKNPGRDKMEEAAEAVGATTLLPIFAPGERAARQDLTDFNDLATKSALGREGVARQAKGAVEVALTRRQPTQVVSEEIKLVQTQKQGRGLKLDGKSTGHKRSVFH